MEAFKSPEWPTKSQLAKFASRMLALDRSVDKIEKRMEVIRREDVKLEHRIANRKQQGTISGIALWLSPAG